MLEPQADERYGPEDAAIASPPDAGGRPRRAAVILGELRGLHEELAIELKRMAEAVESDAPDLPSYTRTRWRLSQKSRRRHKLVDEAMTLLSADSARGVPAAVAQLRLEGEATGRASIAHVQRWALNAVLADWSGYRRASFTLRQAMHVRIRREKEVLYPLLLAQAGAE